jgi:hypothetical protein
VTVSILQSLNSCLQDVPVPAPHILRITLFCSLNIGILSLSLLCNSPEERSSQDDFSHKNNAKNVSSSKTKNYTHSALVPILHSEACSSYGHRNVWVKPWLTCLWHQDNNCVARKCWSKYIAQATNQLLYDVSLLQHGKRLTSGGNECGPWINSQRHVLRVGKSADSFPHFLQCYWLIKLMHRVIFLDFLNVIIMAMVFFSSGHG